MLYLPSLYFHVIVMLLTLCVGGTPPENELDHKFQWTQEELTCELFYFQCSYVTHYNIRRAGLLISLNLHSSLFEVLYQHVWVIFPQYNSFHSQKYH